MSKASEVKSAGNVAATASVATEALILQGLSGARIVSTLAATGGVVGGGMVAGILIFGAAPYVAAKATEAIIDKYYDDLPYPVQGALEFADGVKDATLQLFSDLRDAFK